KNNYFKDKINIIVKAQDTPCGICSSSGTFGHSFSMGKCDLATVIADTSAAADAAATAAANSVKSEDDIKACVDYFSAFDNIYGILIVKDKKIGIWGRMQLA
ncbi:MAG: UPF0280 family protein, partial [Actinobacteria bacterium]|nr:UPF0280 family protein [Actinomycetota bacterium]